MSTLRGRVDAILADVDRDAPLCTDAILREVAEELRRWAREIEPVPSAHLGYVIAGYRMAADRLEARNGCPCETFGGPQPCPCCGFLAETPHMHPVQL
jgi:hypothetical protein